MRTLVLETLIKLLIPLFLLFAIYMFFRGHDHPGGGFIGGLIAVIPMMIHIIAFGPQKTREKYRIKPLLVAASGLLLATTSGMFALMKGDPFMTALWADYTFPFIGKVGTPILFDMGVFLIVSGVVLKVTFLFAEIKD